MATPSFLELLCVTFFPLLFVLAPVMALRFGLEEVIIPTAMLMILCAGMIAVAFFIQHKIIFPQFSSERITTVAKVVLCPPGAIRVVGHLNSNLMAAYDPILLASLLPQPEMKDFAAAYLRDLRYPLKDELNAPAREIVAWYRGEIESQVISFLKKQTDLHLQALLATPVLDPGCKSYCPRCHSQFTIGTGECSECDGVRLTVAS